MNTLFPLQECKDSKEENALLYLKQLPPSSIPQTDKKVYLLNFFPDTSLKLYKRMSFALVCAMAYFSNKSGSFIVGSRKELIR